MTTHTLTAVAGLLLSACSLPDDSRARQDELFDPVVVQPISLDIADADLADLEAQATAGQDFQFVRATFTWNDITLHDVGVRYKGNSSRIPADAKRSYLIKFDEFVDGQELFGLKRLGLDNGIQFGSLFSERLLNDILLEENVPAARATFATLAINGTNMGVYVELERIDKRFLARHFDDNDGNLYKCDEGGPGARLEYLGDDPTLYAIGTHQTFEIKTNEDTADRSDLVALMSTLDHGTSDDVAAAVDLDGVVALMPVMMLGGAFDQYTGFQAHNYYLYRDPSTSKWSYIPHDLDVGFADNAFGMIAVIDGWDAATPRPISPLPLVDRVLDDPDLLARYRDRAIVDLDRYFEPTALAAKLDALYAQIADDLAVDPYPATRVTNSDLAGYPGIVADLESFMQTRYDAARTELGGQ